MIFPWDASVAETAPGQASQGQKVDGRLGLLVIREPHLVRLLTRGAIQRGVSVLMRGAGLHGSTRLVTITT